MNTNLKMVLSAAVAALFAMLPNSSQAQYIGVTCGYDYGNNLTGPYDTSKMNFPLYNPTDVNSTWNEWAAQLKQSGVDFVCPNLEGSQPNTSKNPNKIAPFVTALNNQGNVTKLAIFDDNASSWLAQWNQANGRGYSTGTPFDISNSANWQYIYDFNYKIFYQTVPDANRFKINGRPVIIIWTGGTWAIANGQGNFSRALTYVRQKCQADFGFNPFIIVSQDTLTTDTTCNNPSIIDGVHSWFNPPSQAGTLTTFNGVKIGGLAPSFHAPTEANYMDPNHGTTLDNALNTTVGGGALLTLCEGFSDWSETAALLRVRNLDPSGNPLGYAQTGYDYPNQRLGLLRKHSRNPFQNDLKFEAEGCDTFGGASGGTGVFRNGNIKIEGTSDSGGGWDVGSTQAGEYLEWQNVPLNGIPHFLVRVASTMTCRMHLEINGIKQPSRTISNTGGWQTWQTFDLGTFGSFSNSLNTVRIVFDTGGFNFNWWQMNSSSGGANSTTSSGQLYPGRTFSLLAQVNNKYVTADVSGTIPLIASKTTVGTSEHFTVVDAGNGKIAVRANSNNQYVCADNNGANPLINNRASFGAWESYWEVDAGGGKIGLMSQANGKIVCADNNGANPLIANRISVGPWETYTVGN